MYYTLAAVNARRHNVLVTSAAITFTHMHHGVSAASRKALRLMDRRFGKLQGLEYVDLDRILPFLDNSRSYRAYLELIAFAEAGGMLGWPPTMEFSSRKN